MTAVAVAAETGATVRPVPTGATLRRLPWPAIAVAVFAALAATELVLARPYVSRAQTHRAKYASIDCLEDRVLPPVIGADCSFTIAQKNEPGSEATEAS
jgi:hypothetical protein